MTLPERMIVLKNLVWETRTYQDVMEFLSYDLHDTPSRISTNEGIYFIWRSLMALQILTLSKLLKDDGAFSFQKIVNIAAVKIKGFDKAAFQAELDQITKDYEENKLDTVRDKFVAHLDITSEEIKTDIHALSSLCDQATDFYSALSPLLGGEKYQHDGACLEGIKEIFTQVDEGEMLKAIIMAAQINGKKQIDLTEFTKE